MVVILHALVFLLFLSQYKYNVALATSAADCHERCEQSSGSLSSPGNKYHAMQGHSFKNFTLKKPFDCHLKCFDENCKCQAYQMQADRCELLDEDRFSAPDDFLPASSGYTYFDMHREFVNQVSLSLVNFMQDCQNWLRMKKRQNELQGIPCGVPPKSDGTLKADYFNEVELTMWF